MQVIFQDILEKIIGTIIFIKLAVYNQKFEEDNGNQAGTEVGQGQGQAKVMLEVIVKVGVEIECEVEASYHSFSWCVVVGGLLGGLKLN